MPRAAHIPEQKREVMRCGHPPSSGSGSISPASQSSRSIQSLIVGVAGAPGQAVSHRPIAAQLDWVATRFRAVLLKGT